MTDNGHPDDTSGSTPAAPAAAKPAARAAQTAKPGVGDKPKIGDTRPAPPSDNTAKGAAANGTAVEGGGGGTSASAKRRRRRSRGRGGGGGASNRPSGAANDKRAEAEAGNGADGDSSQAGRGGGRGAASRSPGQSTKSGSSRRRGGRGSGGSGKTTKPVEAVTSDLPVELDDEALERRRGKERNGRPVGRYSMAVHQHADATQIAVLEGRSLLEFYVSRPTDDVNLIHGNVYLGRVQNVLPGMEAAFVEIGTPKNAVLYRGDVHYDPDDVESKGDAPRIEQVLKAKQTILCQVTKNPIGVKGARLTQEISLPGRFVVLVPNSTTFGISKRLSDNERKRLRGILDRVKPKEHGVIIRTAAEGITGEEIERDVRRLLRQWADIEALAAKSKAPTLLYREADMAVRVIREEFNKDYRRVVIDDLALFESVHDYVSSVSPALADRVQYYDREVEPLPLFERHHVHEQLHKALDRKVWLPSGGSLIIEHTEALTVIDVNTGKNVGKSNLEDTVYKNNLEAAEEIAKQLRLRDIGGIIVIDFIDMEIRKNRDDVVRVFREALARDKTRTQVFEISELGLVEMTRKRIGEGLLVSFANECPACAGRGMVLDPEMID